MQQQSSGGGVKRREQQGPWDRYRLENGGEREVASVSGIGFGEAIITILYRRGEREREKRW